MRILEIISKEPSILVRDLRSKLRTDGVINPNVGGNELVRARLLCLAGQSETKARRDPVKIRLSIPKRKPGMRITQFQYATISLVEQPVRSN